MPWNPSGNIKGPKGDKGDPGNAADVAALIHAATSKAPADADELTLLDSTGSWGLRKFTWSTLKALLQSLFFYRGNILGTVSQSSGVPTGAIIQRGSNANGEFVRFADGTMMCCLSKLVALNVPANGVQNLPVWTYPAAFVSIDWAFFGLRDSSADAIKGNIYIPSFITGTPQARNLDTSAVVGDLNAYFTAMGRWF